MTVVSIDDYRKNAAGPVAISFIGFPFIKPEGGDGRLTVTLTLEDGNFDAAIEAVKVAGGIYLPSDDDGGDFWFLPWPCAAVRIRPVVPQRRPIS